VLTWRQIRVWIEKLPPESATWTAVRNALPADAPTDPDAPGPETGRWSQAEMLLASAVEAIRDLHHHEIASNWDTKRGPRPKPPSRIRRPGWRPSESALAPPHPEALAHLIAMLDGTV